MFHLSVVCIMVAIVLGSRYSNTISHFTMHNNSANKGGLQLKITLMVACYFFVPLCHWIWLYGGLRNQVVMVNENINLV